MTVSQMTILPDLGGIVQFTLIFRVLMFPCVPTIILGG